MKEIIYHESDHIIEKTLGRYSFSSKGKEI